MSFFRKKQTVAPAQTRETNAVRILVVSNCQVQPLMHGIGNICKDIVVDTIPVHVVEPAKRAAVFDRHIAQKNDYAAILSVPLSADYGPLAANAIKASFAPTPVFTIANIHFDGTLPDICYVGGLNERMPGPLDAYHSRIAVLGYLMNLPVEATVRLYCDAIYKRLEYYESFQRSLDEMARRDAETDIPLGDLLEMKVREGNCFLSHNHPTSLLMSAYVNKVCDFLAERGLVRHSGLKLSQETLINFLAHSAIFPVYPEIAAYHGLPYSTSYVFRTPTYGEKPSSPLDLQAFVAAEYESFRHADQKVLRGTWPGSALMQLHGDIPEFQDLVAQLRAA